MDIGTLTGQLEIEDNLSSVLNTAAQNVKKFANSFDSLTDVVVVGGAAVVATFTAITGAVIALGNRGSDVNDVSASFERFAGSATVAGETLQKMQDGVLGTVSNFDLMKSASKLWLMSWLLAVLDSSVTARPIWGSGRFSVRSRSASLALVT